MGIPNCKIYKYKYTNYARKAASGFRSACVRTGDILASLGGPSTISTPHSFILNYETLLYFLAPGSQRWGSDRQTPKMSRASCQGDGASTSACSKPSQYEEDRQLFSKEKSAGD